MCLSVSVPSNSVPISDEDGILVSPRQLEGYTDLERAVGEAWTAGVGLFGCLKDGRADRCAHLGCRLSGLVVDGQTFFVGTELLGFLP